MKIFASVIIDDRQATQGWELIENDEFSILVIGKLENGDIIGIVLDMDNIVDLKGSELTGRKLLGPVNISEAELILPSEISN